MLDALELGCRLPNLDARLWVQSSEEQQVLLTVGQ